MCTKLLQIYYWRLVFECVCFVQMIERLLLVFRSGSCVTFVHSDSCNFVYTVISKPLNYKRLNLFFSFIITNFVIH